jgi:DNA-binding NtrC family response regulator
MTRTVLELGGHQVFAFPNGQLALDALKKSTPIWLFRIFPCPFGRFWPARCSAPFALGVGCSVFFLTARSEHSDVRFARNLGADDYLFKPYDAEELLEAVAHRLERRRAIELFESRQAHLQTIIMLANLVEARDEYRRPCPAGAGPGNRTWYCPGLDA